MMVQFQVLSDFLYFSYFRICLVLEGNLSVKVVGKRINQLLNVNPLDNKYLQSYDLE